MAKLIRPYLDNTNADLDTRAVWVALANKIGVPIRCFLFTAPPKLCEHNDAVRALNEGPLNPEKRVILPHSAFSSFASRYREPKVAEGFQDVVRIDFQVRFLRAALTAYDKSCLCGC